MKLLTAIQEAFPDKSQKITLENSHLKLLYSNLTPDTREEVIYRKNGKSVDKIIEFDIATGSKIKTTHYDYFNDKKIRSVDEFDPNSGKKIRTTNYNLKDETKISSVQEYDIETGKIITISIYKRDGRTVSIVKKINPETGKVTSWVNNKMTEYQPVEPAKFSKSSYNDFKAVDSKEKENIAKLIDNLYRNNLKFEHI